MFDRTSIPLFAIFRDRKLLRYELVNYR